MKLRVEKFYTLSKTWISLSLLDALSFATKFCDEVLHRMSCKSHQKFSRLYQVTGRRRLSPIKAVHLFRKLRLWSNKNMTS